jgi:putative flippase GtrA
MDKIFTTRFIRFGIVGILGTGIDFGVTWLCKEQFKINKYLANTIGFICAVCSNYFFNRLWTFESTDNHIVLQFSKFLVVALIGLGINNLLLYLLIKNTKQNFYLLKLIVTGVVVFWNFFANLLYTFH